MHGVKRRAHLLTVGYLSAEQGAELQEGAQKQRAAGWRGGHGGRAAAGQVRGENRCNFPATRSEFQDEAVFVLKR